MSKNSPKRMCSVEARAPSTTLRSLRESRVVPLPRFAGAEEFHPANVPQFFAKFSAPRSDSAKMV